MNNVRPHLTMLTEEQVQDIHRYTLQILATTGVRVDSPSALEMLKKTVGSSNVEETTVRIPKELVEWAIQVAPKRIQIFDRRGNPQFQIGGAEDRIRFGIGVTALYYQEPETDTPVLFERKHIIAYFSYPASMMNFDKAFELGIEAGADDVVDGDETIEIYGPVEQFKTIADALHKAKVHTQEARLRMVPKQEVELDVEATLKFMKMVEAIEELDDVQDVFHNVKVSDEALAALETA